MKRYLPKRWEDARRIVATAAFVAAAFFLILGANPASAQSSSDPDQSGSVGVTGTISAPPPSQAATITSPSNGQVFSEVPVPVRGLCQDGLLVKIFKNNVFGGATQCENGTYEILIDLFTGTNDIVARVFDELDQAGPDSNVVTVEFEDLVEGAGPRVSITSNFAKRGADPTQTLSWPISISGGSGPYAISIDWGDGTDLDLVSRDFPGTFDITHTYDSPGVYNIIIKVSDVNGVSTYLQLVGIANGIITQANADGSPLGGSGTVGEGVSATGESGGSLIPGDTEYVVWPAFLLVPFLFITFWLGNRYKLHSMKKRIQRGEHPFTHI